MMMDLKTIGLVDVLAACAILFLVVRGFLRGCSGELGRLIGIAAAVAVGYFGFGAVSRKILASGLFGGNPYAVRLTVFILMLVLCVAVWLGLGHLLSGALRLVIAQPFDAILGGLIGGIKAFVAVVVLCMLGFLNPAEDMRANFQEHSVAARRLAPLFKHLTSPGP